MHHHHITLLDRALITTLMAGFCAGLYTLLIQPSATRRQLHLDGRYEFFLLASKLLTLASLVLFMLEVWTTS